MVRSLMACLSVAAVLLLGEVIITEMEEIHPILAQFSTTNSGNMNMTTPMMESASFHLKVADRLLMNGNTEAALDQVNLAEIQLALLNMGSQESLTNQTQAVEFITGGSLSSLKMAANCIVDNRAMVRCMQ
jgi:hypothetical protein